MKTIRKYLGFIVMTLGTSILALGMVIARGKAATVRALDAMGDAIGDCM